MNVILFNIKNTIMATLETQYKNYLKENPESTFTFEEWSLCYWRFSNMEVPPHNGLRPINEYAEELSDWDVTLMDGLENESPYVSDDFQIGPDGAYEHSNREIDIRKTMSYICVKLLEVTYNNGDISDIGNEVGVAVGETLKNLSESEVNQFIYGFRHGVSLTNGTHDTIPVTRSTNHGQGDGCF